MMESEYGRDRAKIENMGNLSVPPGFASLTSFILKRAEKVEKTERSTTFLTTSEHEPICKDSNSEINGIAAYKQIIQHRPWILLNQRSHEPEESPTEHLPMDLPLKACRPKGVARGCPDCSNCVKVTARWHPEDARRDVLEEAPIFHPTEEEFKDTLKYIASIHSRAEPYGICRIVPPSCWKPPRLLEKKNIWEDSEFVAQIQRIDGLQVQCAQESKASSCENTKTKRRSGTRVILSSQLGDSGTCTTNNHNVEDFESEPGPKFSLKTFKKFADEFKIQYFSYKDKTMDYDINLAVRQKQWEPSVENIEGEYGRIVQNPTEEIEVLCGSALEAGVFSSGFPTVSDPLEACTYPEILKSGWNLNNILKLPGSLLSFESSEASRNFVPRIHVGMCFSTVNWKVEEHQLYSLSYIHLGEPKVWYSVPGRFAVDFETIRKKYLLDLFAGQSHMHDNLVMQLSCSILKAEGIPVYRCPQYPREFVLVFPGAYHSGFDCGFNYSDSVSFAPLEWLVHGQNVVELYCEQRRKTLISYDKLLLGAAREAVRARWEIDLCMKSTPDNLTWKDAYGRNGILAKAFNSRTRSERFKREYLCNSLRSQRMDEDFDAPCKRECSICLRDLHLSVVGCPCSEDKFACLFHAKQLCSCTWSNKILLYRYEISELNVLSQALNGKLSAVYKWAKEDLGLTMLSASSKRTKQTLENVSGSTWCSEDLKRKKSISQTIRDAYSKEWKESELRATSNALKRKQNEVGSQVELNAIQKILGRQSASTCTSGGINSAIVNSDMKALAGQSTITKKVGDPKASTVSSVTNSDCSQKNPGYFSFLREDMLFEVSSDSESTSTSTSSESNDTRVADGSNFHRGKEVIR